VSERFWYISFATRYRPLGATVVYAASAEAALVKATKFGLNPGGEAAILPVPDARVTEAMVMLNRLVSADEILNNGGHQAPARPDAVVVPQHNNLRRLQ